MGCDIHCYVEYQSKKQEGKWWRSFGGRINPGRNYDVFERLAGVRGENALFHKRGMPEDAGFQSSDDNWMWISYGSEPFDGAVSEETASKYIERGYATKGAVVSANSQYVGKPQYVAHPDWHSHSWVTPDEWEQAITFEGPGTYPPGIEYRALLAAMRVLESDGNTVRVVFWFDN